MPNMKLQYAAALAIIAATGGDYNLVGFDPRGVGASGPDLSCFPGVKGTSLIYGPTIALPLIVGDKRSYGEVYSKAGAFGDFCTKAHSAANSTAKYVNTVATANDMRYYTELLANSKGQDPQKSQLWYYGTSYGSLLGMTYASLFPDRVGRIVADGVVDGEDYYSGRWASNLDDADKGFRYFFQSCFEAGKEKCAFWANSPAAIEARYQALVKEITFNPIPVSVNKPDIITVQYLKLLASGLPSTPLSNFPSFAKILEKLENRDATDLAMLYGVGVGPTGCQKPDALTADLEPRQFIACTDANGRFNLSTFDSFVEHADSQIKKSQFVGDTWATLVSVNCRKLSIKAPKSQVFEGYPGASKTSNPILFISTKVDPATPLRAAEKMTKRFGGAGLLVQDNVGHTSFSSVSKCTQGYIKAYLRGGSADPPDLGIARMKRGIYGIL
ncbi:TAP-like protein-domain-containing protein [Phaeosphaeriaceae sp. PMI808]|nr:TAP-like protein-domain-containing protein [Phaeosphaeriaceae sp. PMI808]